MLKIFYAFLALLPMKTCFWSVKWKDLLENMKDFLSFISLSAVGKHSSHIHSLPLTLSCRPHTLFHWEIRSSQMRISSYVFSHYQASDLTSVPICCTFGIVVWTRLIVPTEMSLLGPWIRETYSREVCISPNLGSIFPSFPDRSHQQNSLIY